MVHLSHLLPQLDRDPPLCTWRRVERQLNKTEKKKHIKSLHGSAWAQLKTLKKKNTCLKIEDQKVLSMHSVVSTSRDEASDDT